MLFYLDTDRRIIDNNPIISYSSALKIMAKDPLAEWHDIDFSFTMGEDRPGFEKQFFLETDGQIRIEYVEIPSRLPTQQEALQAKVDYLVMMVG